MLHANRIALVSGAAGGRAIAVRFARAGAGLVALRRTAGGMTEAAKGFRRLKAWKQSSLPGGLAPGHSIPKRALEPAAEGSLT
jgi:NAD(P)-dependent dehydrogenase (short-subunit alcohol dehydrogenase family)